MKRRNFATPRLLAFGAIYALIAACGVTSDGTQQSVPGTTGATGAVGPQGPQGPQGPPGASGALASKVVWVDSSGNLVSDVIGLDLRVVDESGYFWPIDPETGRVRPPQESESLIQFYEAPNCAGESRFVAQLAPRQVFSRNGQYYTRADTVPAAPLESALSIRIAGGGCQEVQDVAPYSGFKVLPEVSLILLPSPPNVAYAPPLRMEVR